MQKQNWSPKHKSYIVTLKPYHAVHNHASNPQVNISTINHEPNRSMCELGKTDIIKKKPLFEVTLFYHDRDEFQNRFMLTWDVD